MRSTLVHEPCHVGRDDPAVLTSFVDSPPPLGTGETQVLFGRTGKRTVRFGPDRCTAKTTVFPFVLEVRGIQRVHRLPSHPSGDATPVPAPAATLEPHRSSSGSSSALEPTARARGNWPNGIQRARMRAWPW